MPPRMRRRITSARREEIERQQEKISKTIVRPFENLSGLPVSFNPPPNGHYEDVFKNPLTIKDSGVLYRSLMKSRLNYIFVCPMFRLYWMKQSSYAKKLVEQDKPLPKSGKDDDSARTPIVGGNASAREVMAKLCDATLDLGPHSFEIRIFIAKDERSEKPSKKNKDSGEMKIPTAPRDEDTGNNEINEKKGSKDKTDSMSEVNGHSSNDTKAKISEPKAEELDKTTPDTISSIAAVQSGEVIPSKEESSPVSKSNLTNEGARDEEDLNKVNKKESKNEEAMPKDQEETTLKTQPKKRAALKDKGKENVEDQSKMDQSNDSKSFSQIGSEQDLSATNGSDAEDDQKDREDISESQNASETPKAAEPVVMTPNVIKEPAKATESTSNPVPHDNANMQSIENTIMISNLNMIARTDESLNSLMKIVASGNASPQEILRFQGYIKKAREMGPQSHHAYLFASQGSPFSGRKEKKTKEKKLPKPKISNDQKLTAFQEKYLKDATLVFEFAENPNVRYLLPKDAICEVLPSSENTTDPLVSSDNRDVIVSYIWVHNQKELENYNKRVAEYEKYVEAKEAKETQEAKEAKEVKDAKEAKEAKEAKDSKENENLDEQDNKDANQNGDNDEGHDTHGERITGKAKGPPHDDSVIKEEEEEESQNGKSTKKAPQRKLRNKRKPLQRKKASQPKPPMLPEEPELRYTTLSFRLIGIPQRYIPVITNSFEPVETVRKKMSKILEKGTRTASFYLWYQIDGKLDEALAEEIRVQLNQEEKKMQGVLSTNPSKTIKKRKLKDKTDVKPKKTKSNQQTSNDSESKTNMPANGNTVRPQPVPDNGENPPLSATQSPAAELARTADSVNEVKEEENRIQ